MHGWAVRRRWWVARTGSGLGFAESAPIQRVAAESNVRAVLRVRGTSKLTDLGLRYCADERLTGFVEDDARVLNRSQRLQREVS